MDKKITYYLYIFTIPIIYLLYILRPRLSSSWQTLEAMELPTSVPTERENKQNDEDSEEDAHLRVW